MKTDIMLWHARCQYYLFTLEPWLHQIVSSSISTTYDISGTYFMNTYLDFLTPLMTLLGIVLNTSRLKIASIIDLVDGYNIQIHNKLLVKPHVYGCCPVSNCIREFLGRRRILFNKQKLWMHFCTAAEMRHNSPGGIVRGQFSVF